MSVDEAIDQVSIVVILAEMGITERWSSSRSRMHAAGAARSQLLHLSGQGRQDEGPLQTRTPRIRHHHSPVFVIGKHPGEDSNLLCLKQLSCCCSDLARLSHFCTLPGLRCCIEVCEGKIRRLTEDCSAFSFEVFSISGLMTSLNADSVKQLIMFKRSGRASVLTDVHLSSAWGLQVSK